MLTNTECYEFDVNAIESIKNFAQMERFTNAFTKVLFKKRSNEEKSKPLKQKFNHQQPFNVAQKDGVKVAPNFDSLTSAEVQLLLDNIVYPEDIDISKSGMVQYTSLFCNMVSCIS